MNRSGRYCFHNGLVWMLLMVVCRDAAGQVYDPDPEHPWNRLHDALIVRTTTEGQRVGQDTLDVLRWDLTSFLRTEPSRSAGIAAAEAFLRDHAEQRFANDPLRRLILQRDLWAIFDSLANGSPRMNLAASPMPDDRVLCDRLAQIIQRLALSPEEIARLPDNYAAAVRSGAFPASFSENQPQAFLPPDLFSPAGSFVGLSRETGGPTIAPVHVRDRHGRSVFGIFIRLPGGREPTLDYLRTLRGVRWSTAEIHQDPQNRPLPQFPEGTQVLLVRRMLAIDSNGALAATPITESVQSRVFLAIPRPGGPRTPLGQQQFVSEVRLSRPDLFAGRSGGLHAVNPDVPDYPVLYGQANPEAIEKGMQLRGPLAECLTCHSGLGVESLGLFSFGGASPSSYKASQFSDEEHAALRVKRDRNDWGLLKGIMDSHRVRP